MTERVSIVETEFILRSAMESRLPLRLLGAGKSVRALVREVRKDALVLDAPVLEKRRLNPWENLCAYFNFRGKDMTFSSKVLRQEGGRISLAYPDRILRSPARKHPRIPSPRDFSLEITLENEKLRLNYPQCGEYSDVSLPDLREGFDTSSLHSLLDSFRARSSGMASECRAVLFKERKPEAIEEALLAHYGRTLFIPSTGSPLPSVDPYPESRIITASMAREFEGPASAREGSRFDRALAEKPGKGINAEVWCPIQYFQYVVGYVYLANRGDRAVAMDFSVVDCAWEFSRILAYYLKVQNYFKPEGEAKSRSHNAAIVDLSASGCLLSIPKTTMAMRIKNGSMLEMRLSYPEGSLHTRGRVVRRYDEKEGAYYGVSFLDIPLEEMRVFFPKLYELPYSGEESLSGEASVAIGEDE